MNQIWDPGALPLALLRRNADVSQDEATRETPHVVNSCRGISEAGKRLEDAHSPGLSWEHLLPLMTQSRPGRGGVHQSSEKNLLGLEIQAVTQHMPLPTQAPENQLIPESGLRALGGEGLLRRDRLLERRLKHPV